MPPPHDDRGHVAEPGIAIAGNGFPRYILCVKSLVSIFSLALLAVLGAVAILAQTREPAVQRGRLDQLRATIAESEGRLKGLDSAARGSEESLGEYRRQAIALDTLIDALQAEESREEAEMMVLRRHHDSLAGELAELKGRYAQAARALLKRRLLASSGSVLLMPAEHLELALRQHLFERYARVRDARAREITAMVRVLAAQDAVLVAREREQQKVIAEKRSRIERLLALQREGMATLAGTDARRNALRTLIERKNEESRQIAAMIETMARRRTQDAPVAESHSAATARANGGAVQSEAKPRNTGPLHFSWPTSGRRIAEGYGERTNPETGTVTINPGITIDAAAGAGVTAAEDGTVSAVSWLPSFGTVVIVEHRGGYRTVYGNLEGASVSRGTSVSAGERIGTVGGGSGGGLHFEVWQGETRLNPAGVLH
ncbi:MAG: Membrane-bound metallopeptidase [Chlorobi bacterium]|nr:Membrane-bound metallopeptidase [Chlorobiota bacterium]